MRLVMGGESLETQLTGIGQYTYNLALELRKRPEILDFKFQMHGRLLKPDHLMASHDSISNQPQADQLLTKRRQILSKIRTVAAQNSYAVTAYEWLMPHLERRSLRHYRHNDVYHSPNYILPDFPGKRIVSILDLSTYRFPEQHPEARVRFVNAHIQKAMKSADHILTISNVVKNELIEQFKYPEEKITVTYLGANSKFKPHSKEEFNNLAQSLKLNYKSYFLFVSSIEPRKNLERLLDAYLTYRANSENSPLPLIIAGIPGWKSQHIHERLTDLTAKGVVRYLGYVNQNLLPPLIAGARSLLYPSLYEGFGLPVLEGMQSGTAVMTSQNSAMTEIGGEAVLQIDPRSCDSMVDALLQLGQDELAVKEIERRGLNTAKQHSWSRCADQTLQAYQSIIS